MRTIKYNGQIKMKKKENIKVTCADQFELSATLYKPEVLKAAVMIAPATGIKKSFYNSFATHLAENGYGVICFDNRGIGDSIHGSLNAGNASLVTWGTLDMPAILEKLKSTFPNTSYHLIGHSAGGQLIGLMENYADIKSFCNIAASSGSIQNMRYPFKLKAYLLLNVFIPISNALFDHGKAQWFGMGQPLPKVVGSQWRKWCSGRGYAAMDFGQAIQKHWYDDIKAPSQWVYATDDDIANLDNVKEMIRIYSKSNAVIIKLDPKELDRKEIGHMKFFSSKNKDLWGRVLKFLEKD